MTERINKVDLIEALNLYFIKNYYPKEIAEITGISHTTIYKYIKIIKAENISWPIDQSLLNNKTIEEYLYGIRNNKIDLSAEYEYTYLEMKKHKHLTRLVVYNELLNAKRINISYSCFSNGYNKWCNTIKVSMKIEHIGGEEVFVDYAGHKLPIILPDNSIHECQVFVGVLGASGYIFVDITLTQSQEDWINSHIRMFNFFGGTIQILVPDNLKAGVIKPDLYNPEINKAYLQMAKHYNAYVVPARVRRPQDKALAEGAVYNVTNNIITALRNKNIYSVESARQEVIKLLKELNDKPFQKISTSRTELFIELDKPKLGALPDHEYVYQKYKKVRVPNDYHILLDEHFYSVPYKLVNKELDVWYSEKEVKIYDNLELITTHIRSCNKKSKTTNRDHMPKNHQKFLDIMTKDKILEDARLIDSIVFNYACEVFNFLNNEKYAVRKINGILKLSKNIDKSDFVNICKNYINTKLFDPEYMITALKNLK